MRYTDRTAVIEVALAALAVWALYLSVPISMGGIGLSWDSVNHHIYLGWSAEHVRFGQDYMATGLQSYQYPYLYWPIYRMAMSGASGLQAGAVLATLAALHAPAAWLVCRALVDERSLYGASMRVGGTVLGAIAPVVMKALEVTSNDLIASVPVVWAYAVALGALGDRAQPRTTRSGLRAACAGALTGAAVAGKLSNAPLVLVLPLVYVFQSGSRGDRLRLVCYFCASAGAFFMLLYGYWGWQLWQHFGNPFYPFGDSLFELLRRPGGSPP